MLQERPTLSYDLRVKLLSPATTSPCCFHLASSYPLGSLTDPIHDIRKGWVGDNCMIGQGGFPGKGGIKGGLAQAGSTLLCLLPKPDLQEENDRR